jgi:hypothetical protein
MMKNKLMIGTLFIPLVLALGAQIFVINSAAAAPSKIVNGFPGQQQFSSTLTCPDGTTITDSTISFNGAKVNNGATHFQGWSFSIRTPFSQEIFGAGNTAQISPNNFQFKGTIGLDPVCNAGAPSLVSLSGSCGFGVTVKYQAANGEQATFNGMNVSCEG